MAKQTMAEKIEKLFEKETEELREKNKALENALESSIAKRIELENEIKDLRNKVTLAPEIESLFTKESFPDVVRMLKLKTSGVAVDGMGSEDIPNWFKYVLAYYPDRDKLFKIMDMCKVTYPSWAKRFVMPYEYTMEELEIFIDPKYDRYVCNGAIYERNMGFFWKNVAHSQGDTMTILTHGYSFSDDIPWQLVLANPLWADKHMFDMIVQAIKNRQRESSWFFGIQKFNDGLSREQIDTLIDLVPVRLNTDDVHANFLRRNKEILPESNSFGERFFEKINDNSYSPFFFLNYPTALQVKFIKRQNDFNKQVAMIESMNLSNKEKAKVMQEIYDMQD